MKVAIVTFEAGPLTKSYVRESNLSWPLLIDQSRTLYAAYGMERASRWEIYGPASLWAYAKLLFRGREFHRAEGDVYQRGGDVLIDPKGVVRIHHVGSGPADRPAIEALLESVHQRAQ